MTRPTLSAACAAMVATIAAGACAHSAAVVHLTPARAPVASRLADLLLRPGTPAVVELVSGEMVQGTVRQLVPDRLELVTKTVEGRSAVRSIAELEIQAIARLPRVSKRARKCIGAAIGAAMTLPFSISMFGDMVVPGAIAGALYGSRPGDTRPEIIFERPAHGQGSS